MRRSLTQLAAIVLLIPVILFGCGPVPADMDNTSASPALWIVENGEGTVEGWLFGTIHSLPDGVEWRTPVFERALAGSQSLVLEISELDRADEMRAIFTELAFSTGLTPIERRVPPEHRTALAALMQRGGYNSRNFTHVESWAAALTLADVESFGSAKNGVDRALMKQAGTLRALEGTRYQLGIFDQLPERDQRDLLAAVVEGSLENGAVRYQAMVDMWLTGDMAALERETRSGILADPELRAALLVDRNARWTDKIDSWMQSDGPMMVAVGAAHLAGEDGLPVRLARRGYTVRRLQ